ncbi:MAG TPA: hypothetical protein VFR60_02800, partial [Sphingomicrobium sp.]|nr:hypothetical protein [Sphingomicrobium sp.]
MRWIARRLDRDRLAIDVSRKVALRNEIVEDAVNKCGIAGVKGEFVSPKSRILPRSSEGRRARHLF